MKIELTTQQLNDLLSVGFGGLEDRLIYIHSGFAKQDYGPYYFQHLRATARARKILHSLDDQLLQHLIKP